MSSTTHRYNPICHAWFPSILYEDGDIRYEDLGNNVELALNAYFTYPPTGWVVASSSCQCIHASGVVHRLCTPQLAEFVKRRSVDHTTCCTFHLEHYFLYFAGGSVTDTNCRTGLRRFSRARWNAICCLRSRLDTHTRESYVAPNLKVVENDKLEISMPGSMICCRPVKRAEWKWRGSTKPCRRARSRRFMTLTPDVSRRARCKVNIVMTWAVTALTWSGWASMVANVRPLPPEGDEAQPLLPAVSEALYCNP
jgi:hypothetical protein